VPHAQMNCPEGRLPHIKHLPKHVDRSDLIQLQIAAMVSVDTNSAGD
jgi:hypothetical protein